MTDLRFRINGQDFAALVNKNGYRTFLDPVYSGEITTLDGTRRAALLRYRGRLHVTLNDLEESESAALCAALLQEPLTVEYYSFQRRSNVVQQMRVEPYARAQLLRDAGERWISGVMLKFEQD